MARQKTVEYFRLIAAVLDRADQHLVVSRKGFSGDFRRKTMPISHFLQPRTDKVNWITSSIAAIPYMFMAKGPAPALGIARRAIDTLIETAPGKPARRYTVGAGLEAPKVFRDDVYVQDAVGRAETLPTSGASSCLEGNLARAYIVS